MRSSIRRKPQYLIAACGLTACLLLATPSSSFGQTASKTNAISGQERWSLYLKENYGNPGAAFRSAMPAAFAQSNDQPPEWGQGMEGYGKRLADEFASRSISGSVEHGLAAAIKTDPRYQRCECTSFFSRFGHAIARNFVTRRTDGRRVFNAPNVIGRYSGEFVALGWQPDRLGWKDGFREGSQRLIIGGSFNVVREFWPDIRRTFTFGKGGRK